MSASTSTPIGSSWLNQVEIWFGIITRQAIRRCTFASVNHLIGKIRTYVEHWNVVQPRPPADQGNYDTDAT